MSGLNGLSVGMGVGSINGINGINGIGMNGINGLGMGGLAGVNGFGTLVEENWDDEERDTPMDLVPGAGGSAASVGGSSNQAANDVYEGTSPVEGPDDVTMGGPHLGGRAGSHVPNGVGGSMNVLGKPMATNNFVTKLYQ